MNIRKIEATDNKALAQMIRQVFEEHEAPRTGTVFSDPTTDNLFALFQAPQSILWVAQAENGSLGCCGIYPTPALPKGCAELVKFYLDKNLRGQKIGLQLFERSLASAKELGYQQLYIESLPHFDRAVKMYEKFGFTYLSQPLGESGHSSCNIWMLKDL